MDEEQLLLIEDEEEESSEKKRRIEWHENAQKSLWTLLTIAAAILFYYLVQSLGAISGFIGDVLTDISPIISGLVLAYLLGPVARFYERNLTEIFRMAGWMNEKAPKRIRAISAICMVLTAVAFITLLLLLIVPEITNSITSIVKALPSQVEDLMQQLRSRSFFDNDSTLGSYANEAILGALESAEKWLLSDLPKQAQMIGGYFFTGVKGVFKVVYNLVIGLILSLYITIDKEKLMNQLKQVMFTVLPTKTAIATRRMLGRGNKKLSAAIHGKILDSAIIGMIHFTLLSMANLMPWFNYPYPVLLAVIVGVTNVVPFFGPIVGGFITGVLVLFENPKMLIPYLILIVALQQFDGNFLDPHIVGGRIGLRPFWSIFGCLLGSAILGVPGFVLGPPIMAFCYEVISDWTDRSLRKKHLESMFHLKSENEIRRAEDEEEKKEHISELRRLIDLIEQARVNIPAGVEKLREPKKPKKKK